MKSFIFNFINPISRIVDLWFIGKTNSNEITISADFSNDNSDKSYYHVDAVIIYSRRNYNYSLKECTIMSADDAEKISLDNFDNYEIIPTFQVINPNAKEIMLQFLLKELSHDINSVINKS